MAAATSVRLPPATGNDLSGKCFRAIAFKEEEEEEQMARHSIRAIDWQRESAGRKERGKIDRNELQNVYRFPFLYPISSS